MRHIVALDAKTAGRMARRTITCHISLALSNAVRTTTIRQIMEANLMSILKLLPMWVDEPDGSR